VLNINKEFHVCYDFQAALMVKKHGWSQV